MATKKILITGASGFIGSSLVPELLKASFQVVAISRKRITSVDEITWLHGDITNPEIMAKAVEGCDVVVHAAGKTGMPQNTADKLEFFKVNCDASSTLAQIARQKGVKQFIYISSTGVFGPGKGSFSEGSCCNPANVYEESKLAGETAVLAEASRPMRVTVIRPSNVFGEKHSWNKLLTWLRSVKHGRAVLVNPIDKYHVNYVYVGDVARAITALVNVSTQDICPANETIYIINTPATVREFYNASASALGLSTKALIVPKWTLAMTAMIFDGVSSVTGWRPPLTNNKVRELCNQQIFDISKLKSRQPNFPYFGLHEGLRRTCIYFHERGLL